jgi:hypothetical protein
MNLHSWLAAVFVLLALAGMRRGGDGAGDGRLTTITRNTHATGVVAGEVEAAAACSGRSNRTSPDRRTGAQTVP